MKYSMAHLRCCWYMLRGSIIFSFYAGKALLARLLLNEVKWHQCWNSAYWKLIQHDYSDSVTTRGTILLVEKLKASYSHVPLNKDSFMDLVIWCSYHDRYSYDKYRELLTCNDARVILTEFYRNLEMDEGVYQGLLNSEHEVYQEINSFLKAIGHEPLKLESLDEPFVKIIFTCQKGTVIDPLSSTV